LKGKPFQNICNSEKYNNISKTTYRIQNYKALLKGTVTESYYEPTEYSDIDV
jgi:hypothetical protein